MQKQYWKGLEELRGDVEFVKEQNREFAQDLPLDEIFSNNASSPVGTPRRDFLKFLGFTVAAATLASCEAPVRKTIPYLIKPEEITPGVANWYASTYADGHDYCSIIVKTREGRPIKVEGNKSSTFNKGGANARVQASVLSLYDNARLKGPLDNGKEAKWYDVDSKIKTKLNDIIAKKGNIRILSSSIISPSTKKAIAEFSDKHPNTKHITYDAVSFSGMIKANEQSFGKPVIPTYHFDKAKTIVSFGADFLANWLSPIEFANQYIQNRKLRDQKTMSRHIQFESILSLTGSNADKRIPVKPSEQDLAIINLYNLLAIQAGMSTVQEKPVSCRKEVEEAAKELWNNKGKALVVMNSNDPAVQMVVNSINTLLDSYGNTIDLNTPCYLRQGDDAEVAGLLDEMNNGSVAGIILYNSNPAYTMPKPEAFANALQKVGLKISFADRSDETASLCDFVCPDNHYLEAWNDAEPRRGVYSLGQPTIAPLFKTRAAQESLLKWAGNDTDYLSFIKENWRQTIFPHQKNHLLFDTFWNTTLQEGVCDIELGDGERKSETKVSKNSSKTSASKSDAVNNKMYLTDAIGAIITGTEKTGELELVIYEKTGIGNGNQANNPWLLELPDPISRITWDNYITVSQRLASERGLEQGNVVTLEANGVTKEGPILIQPGQAYGTVGIALGYGRTLAGKAANGVGVNAYSLATLSNSSIHLASYSIKIAKTNKENHELAATQLHHTMMGREIVHETSLVKYLNDARSGNEPETFTTKEGKKTPEELNLWNSFEKPKHHFGLAIDLNSCIGCGACVIGCQSENNVPVVGKDEVNRSREMHWIRIDRYYSSNMTSEIGAAKGEGAVQMLHEMEVPSENPQVVFQPVMCQHCNHAPCETVCPVLATSHSSEGLNQMAYNRCVGTRYCANNCPYKVRRFNWFTYSDNPKFDFNMNNDLGKMVLNPDVVVRSRGVMEKCSLCVQKIQEGKLNAKKESRSIKDGEIVTACAQSCPTNAIVFGDYNDPNSELSRLKKDERAYHLLGELDTQPNVIYMTKVRNI